MSIDDASAEFRALLAGSRYTTLGVCALEVADVPPDCFLPPQASPEPLLLPLPVQVKWAFGLDSSDARIETTFGSLALDCYLAKEHAARTGYVYRIWNHYLNASTLLVCDIGFASLDDAKVACEARARRILAALV